jgi:histidine triad (HIT) family protein
MSSCIFCRIISNEIKSKIIYSDDDVVAFEDAAPQAPTHILIVPRVHVEKITDMEKEGRLGLVSKVFKAVAEIVSKSGLDKGGYRVVLNQGSNAGQAVPHVHFHLLSGRKFSWPPG